jgi:hypothetical protein
VPTTSRSAPSWETVYAERRAALLERLAATLRADERFAAAWLTGSFGRGGEDAYSDVDCTAVVLAGQADPLCVRPWRSAGRTTAERLLLLQALSPSPVVLTHDAHGNAPEGGTHTNALYADGTRLDLTLVPLDRARRPQETRLLFQRRPIPPEPPPTAESLAQRGHEAAQAAALFWIMAVATAKCRRRGWDVEVQALLTALRGHVERVRRLVAGEPPRFRRWAPTMTLTVTPAAQGAALRGLCDEMEHLRPAVRQLGVPLPEAPRAQVDWWLSDA